jgi:glycyl-tRNA synthetase beta chain
MGELLLELRSEDIPARMQARACEELKRLTTEKLTASGLSYARVQAFATPRRLALTIDGIPATQPDIREERKGPRVGSPAAAIEGFLKSTGIASAEQCEQRDTGKGVFYFATLEKKGASSVDLLGGILQDVVQSLPWSKSMRWGASAFRWVRPLHSVIALFDGRVIDLTIDATGHAIQSGALTVGHRFLSPDAMTVASFEDYRSKLRAARVMLDQAERRAEIVRQGAESSRALGLSVRQDEALLDEVVGLVEWPVALVGRIDEAFMNLPAEVLTTSMRVNQKYFALSDADGKLASYFLVVANIDAPDSGLAIVAGNERVLRARLSDAKFFLDFDRKKSLADHAVGLKDVVFHARLGSVAEKSARVRALGTHLADIVPHCPAGDVAIAADIAKADLVTGIVGEFPELQGVMGRHYAIMEGLPRAVADAIADHYRPLGPSDECPRAPVSVALALADKLDTLVGFFAIDERPTGSKDPYALRRAALGVIRLILENKLRIKLRPVLAMALANQRVQGAPAAGAEETIDALLEFLGERLKVALREHGARHDLIAAVFAKNLDDLALVVARARALQDFIGADTGINLLTAYRRVNNIVRIETAKDRKTGGASVAFDGDVDRALFAAEEEVALSNGLDVSQAWFADHDIDADLQGAMSSLASLRQPVDRFFDKVTVNSDNRALRANRLRLLSRIARTMDEVADFSRIEG